MSKKILLADDSITIQKVISITFASEDYDLVVVGDGDTAVAKIKEVKPDLVIADIAMPGKNGYEVCDFVKKDPAFRHVPVLLLSGTFEPLNEKEAQRVKSDDHVIKPFESQELIEKVKTLLAKPPAPARVEAEAEKTVTIETKAPMPTDIWEVGDFMGVEEAGGPAKAAAAPPTAEKEIWGVDFFEEPAKEAPQKPKVEEEFIELELKEEEFQPAEVVKPAPPPKPAEAFKAAPEIKPPAPQPPPVPKAPPAPAPPITERVEAKIKEAAITEAPEIGAIPKEKLEEIIRKVSREVIEEIAWEIIPDMAEEMIKEEMRRIREAIAKAK